MSKSGIDTRSGLRKRSNSRPKRSGSILVMVKRVGHQGPGARAASRPHRDALRLGPLDEVRHDQEVARKAHLGDDGHLALQPRPIVSLGCCGRMGEETRAQTLARLVGEFLGLGAACTRVEPGQDRDRAWTPGRRTGGRCPRCCRRLRAGRRRPRACRSAERKPCNSVTLRRSASPRNEPSDTQSSASWAWCMDAIGESRRRWWPPAPRRWRRPTPPARVRRRLRSARPWRCSSTYSRSPNAACMRVPAPRRPHFGLARRIERVHRAVRASGEQDQAPSVRLHRRPGHAGFVTPSPSR